MPSSHSRPLFHISGIPVRGDLTLLIIVTLLAVSAGNRVIADSTLGAYAAFAVGIGAALLFLGGVLAHELGHAFAARRFGLHVEGISLWLLGGAAGIGEARTPRQEGLVAIAGPAVSLGLGGAFLALASLTGSVVPEALTAELFLLGVLNVVLAAFNLLPGLPLDGGRVVRSLVWWRTGDPVRSTVVAAAAGVFISWGLLGVGAWRLLAGDVFGGVWLVVLSFFLRTAARTEVAMIGMGPPAQETATIAQFVSADPLRLSYLATLDDVAAALTSRPQDDVVLFTDGDHVVGVLRADQVAVARADRPSSVAGASMVGIDVIGRFPADLGYDEALAQLRSDPWGMRAVLDDAGRITGVVTLLGATGRSPRPDASALAAT